MSIVPRLVAFSVTTTFIACAQIFDDEEIRVVGDVLGLECLTQEPAGSAFEQAVANYCCAPHSVAVDGATSAGHQTWRALGSSLGAQTGISPIASTAIANRVGYCNAKVDFVKLDPVASSICTATAQKRSHWNPATVACRESLSPRI